MTLDVSKRFESESKSRNLVVVTRFPTSSEGLDAFEYADAQSAVFTIVIS